MPRYQGDYQGDFQADFQGAGGEVAWSILDHLSYTIAAIDSRSLQSAGWMIEFQGDYQGDYQGVTNAGGPAWSLLDNLSSTLAAIATS